MIDQNRQILGVAALEHGKALDFGLRDQTPDPAISLFLKLKLGDGILLICVESRGDRHHLRLEINQQPQRLFQFFEVGALAGEGGEWEIKAVVVGFKTSPGIERRLMQGAEQYI